MSIFWKISSPAVSLIFVLFIGGCAAAPGGGMNPSGMPVSPSGAPTPIIGGTVASASGDKTVSAGSDGSGDSRGAAPSGDSASSAGSGAADGGGGAGVMKVVDGGGVIYDKPLPTMPAPEHMTPHVWPGINGSMTFCRADHSVLLKIEGYVGRRAYPGAPFVNCSNDYSFEVIDKSDKESPKTIVKSPLQSHTVTVSRRDTAVDVMMTETGYVDATVPLEKYPESLSNLEYWVAPNPKRAMDLTENDPPPACPEKSFQLGVGMVNMPNASKIPDCPLVNPALLSHPNAVEFEGAEKALVSP